MRAPAYFGEGIVRVIHQQIGNMNNSLCGPNARHRNRNRGVYNWVFSRELCKTGRSVMNCNALLFDHIVGLGQQRGRHRQPKCLGGR